MSVFLIILFSILFMLFGVLAYGAINDGLRYVYTGASVIFFIWVMVLGLRLAFPSDSSLVTRAAVEAPKVLTIEPLKAAPVPPAAPPVAVPAMLPPLAGKGTSFHLEANQSSPIFRIPNGKRAHVAVYGGGLTVFSGGVVKLSCDRRGFTISGNGDGNQLVACDSTVDVVIDELTD